MRIQFFQGKFCAAKRRTPFPARGRHGAQLTIALFSVFGLFFLAGAGFRLTRFLFSAGALCSFARRLGSFPLAWIFDQLNDREFRAVTLPPPESNDPRIAAGTILETLAQLVEEPL